MGDSQLVTVSSIGKGACLTKKDSCLVVSAFGFFRIIIFQGTHDPMQGGFESPVENIIKDVKMV